MAENLLFEIVHHFHDILILATEVLAFMINETVFIWQLIFNLFS